jgi:hypothetical protein
MPPVVPIPSAATLSGDALYISSKWQMDYQISELFDVESQVNTETQLTTVNVLKFIEEFFDGEMCEDNAENQFTIQEFLGNVEKYLDGETS